jgi:uncharacterized protein YkwD
MRNVLAPPPLATLVSVVLLSLLVSPLLLLGSTTSADSLAPTAAPAPRGAQSSSMVQFEDRLMVQINEARVSRGLRPIRHNSCVDRLAEGWSRRIVRTGVLEHRDQGEVLRTCDTVWAGENLVRGAQLSPAAMVRAWLNSPGHRTILLHRNAKRAGIAVAPDSAGRLVGVLNVARLR